MKALTNLLIAAIFLFSCDSNDAIPETSQLELSFDYNVDGTPLVFDELNYQNEAGNTYEVTELMWFISDIYLIKSDNSRIHLTSDQQQLDWAVYIDTNDETTSSVLFDTEIPVGEYTHLELVFGFDSEKNESYMYPNPPESNMLWPENLGGGYHYMKFNGFWIDLEDQRNPFNFHLGIGRVEEGEEVNFVDNSFKKLLLVEDMVFEKDKILKIRLTQNLNEWFDNPTVYDFNIFGERIMMNQEAMGAGVTNGRNGVFSAKIIDSGAVN